MFSGVSLLEFALILRACVFTLIFLWGGVWALRQPITTVKVLGIIVLLASVANLLILITRVYLYIRYDQFTF